MPEKTTQKQRKKVGLFVEHNSQDQPIQKLDMRISYSLTIFGAAIIILVLFVRYSLPAFLNSVYIYLGVLNIAVSICLPFLYWQAKYHNRSDWKIAIYKVLWIYFSSIIVVVIGLLVTPFPNMALNYLQNTYYDMIEVRILMTLIRPMISFAILYSLSKAALSYCNLIDYRWILYTIKSSLSVALFSPNATTRDKMKLKTYFDICLVYSSADYLMTMFVLFNYVALWPLVSGVIVTDLSRYYATPVLFLALIIAVPYFLWKLCELYRYATKKQVGAIQIYSCIELLNAP
jgi:hypothetical protein